jgi:hypothetical protein
MKKLFTSALLVAFVAMQASAQQSVPSGTKTDRNSHKDITPIQAASPKAKSLGKGTMPVSEWYSYLDLMKEGSFLPSTQGLVSFLAHDTLAKFVNPGDTTEYDRVYLGAGIVLDPKDEIIDLTANPDMKLTNWTPYMVDSIAFRYLYCRYNDSIDDGLGNKVFVQDTLLIFTYKSPGITQRTSSTQKWGSIDWETSTRLPKTPFSVDTILLGHADTTERPGPSEDSWKTATMIHGLNTPVVLNKIGGSQTNNLVGFVVVFKSGIMYDTSYTFIHEGTSPKPADSKRINYFGIRSEADLATPVYSNTKYYNSTLFALPSTAYPNTQGFFGLQSSRIYTVPRYLDGFFKVNTTGPVGLDKINNDHFSVTNVFPNPADVNGSAVIGFNLKNSAKVSINVYSLVGQVVKTVTNSTFASGINEAVIDLTGLKAGIYMVNMTVNGVSETKKLTITE